MTDQERLILLARAAKDIEGAEGWGRALVNNPLEIVERLRADQVPISFHRALSRDEEDPDYIGPLPPHNPLDPMNPAAMLERAGVKVVSLSFGGGQFRIKGRSIHTYHGEIPTYIDESEALIFGLYPKAQSEGGDSEWGRAWGRAMTPK